MTFSPTNILQHKHAFLVWVISSFLFITGVNAQDTLLVNMVVHIVQDDPNAITDQDVQQAIIQLNDGFAHRGRYMFGKGADTRIRFQLATIAPDGGSTNGITRTSSVYGQVQREMENGRLKNLIGWDPKRYYNVWLVKRISGELYAEFSCGIWKRGGQSGYSEMYPETGLFDGSVVSRLDDVLIHETGHYLGLKDIFDVGNCKNDDCSVDGDGICDTPPQSINVNDCTPTNSCQTDTLSGFTTDQPDMIENFMGYSGCRSMFTAGQGDKMREIIRLYHKGILSDGRSKPCNNNLLVRFDRNNWYPVPGTTVTFTAVADPTLKYEWEMDDQPVGFNSPVFSYTFLNAGKYKLTVKVRDNSGCFASYTHNVLVNCGVKARFFPGKRTIASNDLIYTDSIFFSNQSKGANQFKWLMRHDKGMAEQVVGTEKDLNYVFRQPYNYFIRLVASNGTCSDTTDTYRITVLDPMPDAEFSHTRVDCYDNTKLRVNFGICNRGFQTIPSGLPVSFYDRDPRLPNASKLGETQYYSDSIPGKCCFGSHTFIVETGGRRLDTVFIVLNNPGKQLPLRFPATSMEELNYLNNVFQVTGFRFQTTINPGYIELMPDDSLQLNSTSTPVSALTHQWTPASGLSCTDCPDPMLIAGKNDLQLRMVATNSLGCTDTATASIRVVPGDDFTLKITDVNCYREDSVLVSVDICNVYLKKRLPKSLRISLYDAHPHKNGRLLKAITLDQTINQPCSSFAMVVPREGLKNIYAVVNDALPGQYTLPNTLSLLELRYDNNLDSGVFVLPQPVILPKDTSVLIGESVILTIKDDIYHPSSVQWVAGGQTLLSCPTCSSSSAVVRADDEVRMTMLSQFGCTVSAGSSLRILPPDLTISLIETECVSSTYTRAVFSICMNNQYDTLTRNIPVRFYADDPSAGAKPLGGVFYTGRTRMIPCDTFSVIVPTPKEKLYAIVNHEGKESVPSFVYPETNYSNNTGSIKVDGFRIKISPSDTQLYRGTRIQLEVMPLSGRPVSYEWQPDPHLSCTNCPQPMATVPYSKQFRVTAKNRYGCIDKDTVTIETFSDGPVQLPTAFTPNGDGLNDVFYVISGSDVKRISDFQVFNRFGERIFWKSDGVPNNPLHGWNGQLSNGQKAAPGAYIYQLIARFRDGRSQVFKGSLLIIR